MGLPRPEPGLVVNYAYLWQYEHRAGREEGRKDRPAVIALFVANASDEPTIVTVLPMTRVAPSDPVAAIEFPLVVKKHLGLDHARSWAVVDEGNECIWPGYDLKRTATAKDYAFGFLPPRLFDKIRDAFVACHRNGKARIAKRA